LAKLLGGRTRKSIQTARFRCDHLLETVFQSLDRGVELAAVSLLELTDYSVIFVFDFDFREKENLIISLFTG
jgi:hypothetical protein